MADGTEAQSEYGGAPLPRLLLVATLPWMFQARLANALRQVGFDVEAVCRPGHPIRLLQRPVGLHSLGWLTECGSVRKAIERFSPEIVVPCDDPAVMVLHQLHRQDRSGDVGRLIEQSIGLASGFPITAQKSSLIALAHSLGIRAPRSTPFPGGAAIASLAFPCVLKRDQTWGGCGTEVVASANELKRSRARIAGWHSMLRAGSAAFRDRRPRTLLDRIIAPDARIEVQDFIAGLPANRAVLCREGKVLAGLSVVALETSYPEGPASLVRIIDHAEMSEAVDTLVARLGLSGFCGFDFVLDPHNQAYLIELNPRATPISHFVSAAGGDLPGTLFTAATGSRPRAERAVIPGDLVAIFPNAWEKDRNSDRLKEAYHDIPFEEPHLLTSVGMNSDDPALLPVPGKYPIAEVR